jgi:hypothetical protein
LLATVLGCGTAAPPVDPTFVAEWMQNHYGLIRSERISPPVAARLMAYSAVAVYEGIATNSTTLRSLAGQLNGLDSLPRPEPNGGYDPQLVALEAERTVLDSLYREGLPQTKAALASLADSLRAARIARGLTAAVQTRSTEHGRRLGLAILDWARRDGFDTTRTRPWTPTVGRQYWVNSSGADEYVAQNLSGARDFVAFDNPSASLKPGLASERALIVNRPKPASITTVKAVNPVGATEPWWGLLRPFGLRSATECPIAPPPGYDESPDSEFYREAKATYESGSNLDEEKHRIVLYWADNPGQSGTPVGHWLSIGSQMVAQVGLDGERAAELYVLASLAQADAFIAAWHVKYQTMVVRPITYINRVIDPQWQTDIITPPFPEYPSGHSVQSGAAAAVMTALLGASVAFDDSTNLALGHPVRRFGSFWEAAKEAAISRLYGGIHYPMAVQNGTELGRCIGEKIIARIKTRPPG